jgi:hypothetical protein
MTQPYSPQQPMGYPPAAPLPPKKGFPTWLIVLLAVLGVGVVLIATLATLAVTSVKLHQTRAKNAEAISNLGQIGKAASATYARERGMGAKPAFCLSARAKVPTSAPRGTKYVSGPTDWLAGDESRGWACLNFDILGPQYYSYGYVSKPPGFTATAEGDLDGNGTTSSFALSGEVVSGTVIIAPRVLETNPEE